MHGPSPRCVARPAHIVQEKRPCGWRRRSALQLNAVPPPHGPPPPRSLLPLLSFFSRSRSLCSRARQSLSLSLFRALSRSRIAPPRLRLLQLTVCFPPSSRPC